MLCVSKYKINVLIAANLSKKKRYISEKEKISLI